MVLVRQQIARAIQASVDLGCRMPGRAQGADAPPFTCIRDNLRDLLTAPVQRWTSAGTARRTATTYHPLLTIPLDLAACGFTVTISQTDAGWELTLGRPIRNGPNLQAHAVARSYAAALFQPAHTATRVLDQLESDARQRTEPWDDDDEDEALPDSTLYTT